MKIEGWWLVLGDVAANHLLAVRRVTFGNAAKAKLDFTAPAEPGTYKYTLYFMCDSYTGCDQEYEVKIHVK
jgi:pre-mRNA-splicing helicase BRR2